MKKIIYRKRPMEKYHLFKSEDECTPEKDIQAEADELKNQNPDWDIGIIDADGLSFIIKENESKFN
jgi:hypothetical protein